MEDIQKQVFLIRVRKLQDPTGLERDYDGDMRISAI